ncbi:HNH endonuclease [Cyanobium sp. A2C-AMD]|uniref:HNH endonuclease n=1 Tax=Cyanobium sp. A2C-AMD TaxID=2823695 RepID=UPI0020CE45DE|nr:HNH endonuclease signature motif containing protein [Cyanobium sp. A2C-AMD]MCP9877830.1 HNH endonuclease [Cyanobium sp. A2C-AMD]
MSQQKFSAAQREAIWLAHERKCAYTRELLDLSAFHIDHVIPESLLDQPSELARIKGSLGLDDGFSVLGYDNLLPCKPGCNLQKSSTVLNNPHTHFFLGIAASKKNEIVQNLERIEKRKDRGRALVLLQQCLERGDLRAEQVSDLLARHSSNPREIFDLLESMSFADKEEIRSIARSDIASLRDRPLRLGQNDHIDGVTLTHNDGQQRYVRTCREYESALEEGYFAYSTFDMKMATWFEHQCGLLRSLKTAAEPTASYLSDPSVGITELALLPFSMFPRFEVTETHFDPEATYQDKVDDGSLVVRKVKHNLLRIEQEQGMGQQLIEVARADFNGDGIEDILLFEYCYATHGTMGFGGIRIITRLSANALFQALSDA